ncbi:MAG: TRAP transporter small permease [Gammaproteobacteria bacterium]|nr:TRAP transporter small permease [Gammaproteobacteria bacterium]MBU0787356.1 TRAP transporter small permease [Gammaproteobacteria bacterium]MBU0816096.1 TRAP transporter small permease [Gammaproteobacteria bacterium]MBU1787635.1 TRAP transporter small permease [Gammaproteobacteria bacterium]
MKILDRLEEWIISLMLFAMTALAFMQVVRRYVFNTGFSWTLELTMVCFATMIFVGISYGVRVGSHIGVDALVRLMPHQTRRVVSILAVVLSLVYVGLVLYGSTIYVSKMMEIGVELDDLPIERWKVLIIMPIGYVLVGFRFLQIFYNLVTGKTDSLHLADEAADAMKLKAEESTS